MILKDANLGMQFYAEGDFFFLSPDKIKRFFGIDYLPSVNFSKEKDFYLVKKLSLEAMKDEYLTSEVSWLGNYFSKDLSQKKVTGIYIKKYSLDIGWGAYAKNSLEEGRFLGEYTGHLRRKFWLFSRANDYCFSYPTSSYFFRQYTIDALLGGNETRFINHSDVPNCEAIPVFHDGLLKIVFRTVCHIEKDEHLTIDYGERYWNSRRKNTL
jgi:uncharacterized protein